MKRYEYKFVDDEYLGLEDRMAYLNKMGMEGWLLIQIKHWSMKSTYYFVRELNGV